MSEYEAFLRRAMAEGWRQPNKVADLEMEAYAAGVRVERRRVLGILEGMKEGDPMRSIDVHRLINQIENPNGK
jgi:hypothetical protein